MNSFGIVSMYCAIALVTVPHYLKKRDWRGMGVCSALLLAAMGYSLLTAANLYSISPILWLSDLMRSVGLYY